VVRWEGMPPDLLAHSAAHSVALSQGSDARVDALLDLTAMPLSEFMASYKALYNEPKYKDKVRCSTSL
jgi:hypothetical protein